jgi:hypothetical protein
VAGKSAKSLFQAISVFYHGTLSGGFAPPLICLPASSPRIETGRRGLRLWVSPISKVGEWRNPGGQRLSPRKRGEMPGRAVTGGADGQDKQGPAMRGQSSSPARRTALAGPSPAKPDEHGKVDALRPPSPAMRLAGLGIPKRGYTTHAGVLKSSQVAPMPASTGSAAPVMPVATGDERKAIAAAMSPGDSTRPSGWRSA